MHGTQHGLGIHGSQPGLGLHGGQHGVGLHGAQPAHGLHGVQSSPTSYGSSYAAAPGTISTTAGLNMSGISDITQPDSLKEQKDSFAGFFDDVDDLDLSDSKS